MIDNMVFEVGGAELLDQVGALWQKLNDHHQKNSTHFKEVFARNTFEKRKAALMKKAETGILRVELVKHIPTGEAAAYSITTISGDKVGELDSLFVEPEHRGLHLGERLIMNALEWMNANGVRKKQIAVAVGNEDVLPFYEKFGFYPCLTILYHAGES